MTGFGNQKLMLDRESITENLRQIQMNWGLKPVEYLQGEISNLMFTIEMETGTGKTYTYIKTMYELNKLYGWNKFIIVVPSIAIVKVYRKVLKTMQGTLCHRIWQTVSSSLSITPSSFPK